MTTGKRQPCPLLPVPDRVMSASDTRKFGKDRGEEFYLAALTYAQSLWLENFPARALLLLNRAMGADLGEQAEVLVEHPVPYRAVAWILRNHFEEEFIGNPRRHWQHLATRMSGPRPELRTWRAWACWALARRWMPEMPADEKQIAEEGVVEPTLRMIEEEIGSRGWDREVSEWKAALAGE